MKTISFLEPGLPKEPGRFIKDLGFEEPTPIQALSIPMLREGVDVTGRDPYRDRQDLCIDPGLFFKA